jgi:hypothetical protein
MDQETPVNKEKELESPDRRDLLQKFGKFAAYAAPFTVLAFSQKADAATGIGPIKHSRTGK